MKVYEIPAGKHFAFFRKFNAFDAIQPIRLVDDRWILSEDSMNYLKTQYLDADEETKQNHMGIVPDVLTAIDQTIKEVKKFNLIDIDIKKEIHPMYKPEQIEEPEQPKEPSTLLGDGIVWLGEQLTNLGNIL